MLLLTPGDGGSLETELRGDVEPLDRLVHRELLPVERREVRSRRLVGLLQRRRGGLAILGVVDLRDERKTRFEQTRMDRKRAELAGQARRRVDARARDARAADRVGALDGEAALERELDRVLALRVELLAQRQSRHEARGRATLDRRGRVAELRGLLEVGRSVDRGRHRVGSPREHNRPETQRVQGGVPPEHVPFM